MLNIETIKKYDSQKICDVYNNWPELAKSSFFTDLPKLDLKNIDHIVFAGMGGSGTIGDVISSILSKTDVHVSVTKGYLLPKTVDKNTLVVVTSVSGNTKESLTILEKSFRSEAHTVAFSSGGKIMDFCQKNNITHFKISEIHSPRGSFTSFLYSILNVMEYFLPIKKTDIEESIKILEQTKLEISSFNLSKNNPALNLACWITQIPIIYYPCGFQSVAIRFKNSLQENAKTHVIVEDVIEACHNSIVSWEGKQNVQPILIQGVDDYIKTQERWGVLRDFFNSKTISYYEISSVNGNIISKIINLIYMLDYASIYNALINEIDPNPVQSINYVKNLI